MDIEHYKYKVLLTLSYVANGALKRHVLTRSALHHMKGPKTEMLLSFMVDEGLIKMEKVRRVKGAGSPPTYIILTDKGKNTLERLKKERKNYGQS